MPGPYFRGQQSISPCGCYYPDACRTDSGVIHCCFHGWQPSEVPVIEAFVGEAQIPSDEWREAERQRLREDYPQNPPPAEPAEVALSR